MYRIIIEYKGPPYLIYGVKEELAMHCEKHGDCRVVSIEEVQDKIFYHQMGMYGTGGRYGNQ